MKHGSSIRFSVKNVTKQFMWDKREIQFIKEMISMIRIRKDAVARHFYEDGHTLSDFSLTGIEKVFGDETYRKIKEPFSDKEIKNYNRTV